MIFAALVEIQTSSTLLKLLVEMRRVELLTSALRTQRSAKLSYIPTPQVKS